MFPSCLDLTRSFNILLFISLLFTIPVTILRLPFYIRIFSLSVRFSAQQFSALASKKAFLVVYFFAASSRSKMQISSSTYCFVVKRKKLCPNRRVNTRSSRALGNYVTLTTFYE